MNPGGTGFHDPAYNHPSSGYHDPATSMDPAFNHPGSGFNHYHDPATIMDPAVYHDPATIMDPAGYHDPATNTHSAGYHDPAANMHPAGYQDPATNMHPAGYHDPATLPVEGTVPAAIPPAVATASTPPADAAAAAVIGPAAGSTDSDRFDAVEKRLDSLADRLDSLEGSVQQDVHGYPDPATSMDPAFGHAGSGVNDAGSGYHVPGNTMDPASSMVPATSMDSGLNPGYGYHGNTPLPPVIYTQRVITFGGTEHFSDSSSTAGAVMEYMTRPEQIKSLVKIGDAYEECTDINLCWHGCKKGSQDTPCPSDWGNQQSGDGLNSATVDLPAGTPITTYVYEAWVRCLGENTIFKALAAETTNGVMRIYANGELMEGKLWTTVWDRYDYNGGKTTVVTPNNAEMQFDEKTKVDYNFHVDYNDLHGLGPGSGPVEDFIIRAEFTPTDASQRAWAQFDLRVDGATAFTDTCMTTKFCLDELAGGSMGFKVRNSHEFQLKCLDNTAEDEVKDVCAKWKECLQKSAPHIEGEPNHLDLLYALLKATTLGTAGAGSFIQHGEHAHANAQREECFDPSVADPERLECDCQDGITSACKDSPDGLVKCIQGKLCKHPGVCQSWKDAKCGGELVQRSELTPPALLHRAQALAEATDAVEESVDRAVLGKTCSD
jgi:hypothetical protein